MKRRHRVTEFKNYQLKIPLSLHEAFFSAFPGRGERKLLLERFMERAVALKGKRDLFIEAVLQEAREAYTNLEEEEWE